MNFAIILAAGQSKRMNGINKLFLKIRGKPLVFYTLRVFDKTPEISKIILVTRKTEIGKFSALIKKFKFKKICKKVVGGKERQDSAFVGLNAAAELGAKKGDLILFHNGANPLVDKKDIRAVIEAGLKYRAAAIGQIAKDTVKETNEKTFVIRTLDRKNIFLAQTPQAIEYSLAQKAFKNALKKNYESTDDVGLVEKIRKPVKMVPCSYKNIKVTTKDDLKIIDNFLSK